MKGGASINNQLDPRELILAPDGGSFAVRIGDGAAVWKLDDLTAKGRCDVTLPATSYGLTFDGAHVRVIEASRIVAVPIGKGKPKKLAIPDEVSSGIKLFACGDRLLLGYGHVIEADGSLAYQIKGSVSAAVMANDRLVVKGGDYPEYRIWIIDPKTGKTLHQIKAGKGYGLAARGDRLVYSDGKAAMVVPWPV